MCLSTVSSRRLSGLDGLGVNHGGGWVEVDDGCVEWSGWDGLERGGVRRVH